MPDATGTSPTHAQVRAFDSTSPRTLEVPSTEDVHISTGRVLVRDFFGSSSDRRSSPQAYLVEDFPPNSTTGAHFHDVDQFQVFFGSPAAWYQRTDVRDTLVHYSDAYTTYGPFGARGGGGLSFLTLRERAAGLTAYMPGSRDRLEGSPKRNRHASVPGDQAVGCTPMFGPEDDGLAAHLVLAEPGEHLDVPAGAGGSGQFFVVLAGRVRWGDMDLGPMSLGWVGRGGTPPDLVVGGDGRAGVLVLRFPDREDAAADA